MRGFRALFIAGVAGFIPAIYFAAWFKWPAFLAVGVGAVVAVVMLMVIASIGSNPAAEEAAWREASPDLVRTAGAPGPSEHPSDGPRPRSTGSVDDTDRP
jgi:hypothetical protein